MNIQKYMALLKTVETGSFTKASEALSYSQSGISRMVQDIERELGIALLERGRGGIRPTCAGVQLLPQIQRLCSEYHALEQQVADLKGLDSGLIRIGALSSVATHWLPHIIREFRKDYPNIEYELLMGDYHEIEAWIQEGRVDCGFVHLPTLPELDTVFLEQDAFLAILPTEHPLAQRERVSFSELANEPFLVLKKGNFVETEELMRENGFLPNVRFAAWDDFAILSMVECGLGVSILPQLILRRNPYHVAIREFAEPAYRRIALALRDRHSAPPAVRRFLDYLPYHKG